ncbi:MULTISPECIES: hypothetical protein [unclassified Chryseobacterium]|uniref:hypothetical protein n=1 Tax=unclassified Chryseobacterium TaxID=2593645 RepID=UPI0022699C8B|nr:MULTISPECIES: hypothetical protein [unclassified Chryseobacterium]
MEGIDKGLTYSNPEDIDFGNAFIPIVSIVPNGKDYEFKDKDGYWKLDVRIDNDKRSPKMQRVRLVSTKSKVKLKFKVEKGNKTADDDTGIIVADIYNTSNQKAESKKIKTSYGSSFEMEIDSFKVSLIKFYADDDDLYFDGGISHVFCGGIKIGDCQDELKIQTTKTLNLTPKQKDIFKSTVLVESSGGVKELEDIAYIYLNLVNDLGFEKGMSRSNAYLKKQFMYKVHMYRLGNKEFGEEIGEIKKNTASYGKKVSIFYEEYIKKEDRQQAQEYCKFIDEKILCENPKTKYLGWHGQGNNVADMQINDGINGQWETARQYYWLQKQCKVQEKLVVELKGFNLRRINSTTCIYHLEKIIKYFKENPSKFSHPVKAIPYDPNVL